ncbi:MAG: 30S ribosomal protein S6e [Candidatus Aenigmarchaeota archaeon]|nr:30S ribosomal protein S6e [Candidatus Aenigmarchaeota archaeon]
MNFKVVISDPKTRKAYNKEIEQAASSLLGKKVGEVVTADALGLSGFKIEITGGSDKDGFPMRRDVEGATRKRILLADAPGFKPARKGHRKRKTIRGNTISSDIVQVNAKVIQAGGKAIEEQLGKKDEKKEGKAEAKKEEKAEGKEAAKDKPAEKKEEAKEEKK